jgi:hypothetical protein
MSDDSKTCERCGMGGLIWNRSKAGKWYLGHQASHTFEDGNTVTTHVAAHDCKPTPEGIARMEQKAAERAAEQAAAELKLAAEKAELAKLHHVNAEVGDKITLTGVVTMATTLEGAYGRQKLVIIKTDDYAIAKMITTADWAWGVDFDEVITVTATVKDHTEYQGLPQSVLTRPKLVSA